MILKIAGLIKKITDTGLVKPLPLTGLGTEIAKVRDSKNKLTAGLRIAAYVLGGLIVWGVIYRGLPISEAIELLKMFF